MLLFANSIFSNGAVIASAKKNIQARDTLEFRASTYVIQPNDKLEDLLKRISAISVDKDGKVYSQGDQVTKLLVDGEEYFSDDVTVAGHIIRADQVDKIKIYWRLSDQASFTNIDDNVKIKTMNVILKKKK
ncbi:hypothetical protein [Mucilaginibacter sp.]